MISVHEALGVEMEHIHPVAGDVLAVRSSVLSADQLRESMEKLSSQIPPGVTVLILPPGTSVDHLPAKRLLEWAGMSLRRAAVLTVSLLALKADASGLRWHDAEDAFTWLEESWSPCGKE